MALTTAGLYLRFAIQTFEDMNNVDDLCESILYKFDFDEQPISKTLRTFRLMPNSIIITVGSRMFNVWTTAAAIAPRNIYSVLPVANVYPNSIDNLAKTYPYVVGFINYCYSENSQAFRTIVTIMRYLLDDCLYGVLINSHTHVRHFVIAFDEQRFATFTKHFPYRNYYSDSFKNLCNKIDELLVPSHVLRVANYSVTNSSRAHT